MGRTGTSIIKYLSRLLSIEVEELTIEFAVCSIALATLCTGLALLVLFCGWLSLFTLRSSSPRPDWGTALFLGAAIAVPVWLIGQAVRYVVSGR